MGCVLVETLQSTWIGLTTFLQISRGGCSQLLSFCYFQTNLRELLRRSNPLRISQIKLISFDRKIAEQLHVDNSHVMDNRLQSLWILIENSINFCQIVDIVNISTV